MYIQQKEMPVLSIAKNDGKTARCADKMSGLLVALVACAGVTLNAVATTMGIDIKEGTIKAEGDLDFKGTLGVSKEVPVGFKRSGYNFFLNLLSQKNSCKAFLN